MSWAAPEGSESALARCYSSVLSKQVWWKGLQMHLVPQCHCMWQCIPSQVGVFCALKEGTEIATAASIPRTATAGSNERGWNRLRTVMGLSPCEGVSAATQPRVFGEPVGAGPLHGTSRKIA